MPDSDPASRNGFRLKAGMTISMVYKHTVPDGLKFHFRMVYFLPVELSFYD